MLFLFGLIWRCIARHRAGCIVCIFDVPFCPSPRLGSSWWSCYYLWCGSLHVWISSLACVGMNNTYLINGEQELAVMYNDVSCLENHHAATFFRMVQKDEVTFSGKQLHSCAIFGQSSWLSIWASDYGVSHSDGYFQRIEYRTAEKDPEVCDWVDPSYWHGPSFWYGKVVTLLYGVTLYVFHQRPMYYSYFVGWSCITCTSYGGVQTQCLWWIIEYALLIGCNSEFAWKFPQLGFVRWGRKGEPIVIECSRYPSPSPCNCKQGTT